MINDSLPAGAEVSFINANDGTCEGVNYHNIPAFSVQFHPEACGGPLDTMFLFEKFMTRMEEEKHAAEQKAEKVMVIGSGPIVIGQAAEFDYAGTQACRALREEGWRLCW